MKKREPLSEKGGRHGFSRIFLVLPLLVLYSGCTVVRSAPQTIPGESNGSSSIYFLKQRAWTLGERFVVRDGRGLPIFHVRGKLFSIGDRLKFFDLDGVERVYIKQRLFSLRHLFKVYRNGKLAAKMTKRLRLFADRFKVDVPGGDDYVIRGNFPRYHYRIHRNGRVVARISKRWPSWTDQYRIEIEDGEDDLLILAAAVVVDMVSHRNDSHQVALIYP